MLSKRDSRILRDGIFMIGRETDDADPDGGQAHHFINEGGTVISRYNWAGGMTEREHDDARRLRDNWERGRLCADAQAGGKPRANQHQERSVSADRAWKRHKHCFKQIGRDHKPVLEDILLHDEPPASYGRRTRCHGPTALGRALAALATYFERHERICTY